MIVFSNKDKALEALEQEGKRTHKMLFLDYILYGQYLRKIEYRILSEQEIIGRDNCLYIYLPVEGISELKNIDDLDLEERVIATHHCGDNPEPGYRHALDEITFKINY